MVVQPHAVPCTGIGFTIHSHVINDQLTDGLSPNSAITKSLSVPQGSFRGGTRGNVVSIVESSCRNAWEGIPIESV